MRTKRVLIANRFLATACNAAASVILIADPGSAAGPVPQGPATKHQVPKSSSPIKVYESYANGRQSYPNPNWQLYQLD
jgi:hypothetical protein